MEINLSKLSFLSDPFIGLSLISLLSVIFFILYTMSKIQTISALKSKINYLNKTIQDLDEQAKLIIKGDMELKLYQQEIEDKLNKLTLIKNLIISSIHILDREKLFLQINERVVNDLGFKKSIILDFGDLEPKTNVGFATLEVEKIKNIFKYKKDLLKGLQLLSSDSDLYKQISAELGGAQLLCSPIRAKGHIYAIFIVSDLIMPISMRRSDQEAFSIIGMYLSQCLENIGLFEDLYHNRDDLERRIKERTNELVKSLREIETISKAKSAFISSVSHELRTPLTSVKGFSSLLVEEKFGKLPDQAKERLIKIDENVNKLMDIVNTLLDISRIESGRMEIKIAPFDIVKLISDVADFLAPQVESNGLQLNLDAPKAVNVFIDKNLIERVLINLINNAIKFTSSGGKITVKVMLQNHKTLISISDTGCGIKSDDMDKIFQEFFRVESTSTQVKGSGLGLSLVKRIIDTHKEKIWVESEPGKGSTFYFTLRPVEK